jgi:hypothetical protein
LGPYVTSGPSIVRHLPLAAVAAMPPFGSSR